MKIHFILLLILWSNINFGQCPQSLIINSNSDIDKFLIDYPNCKILEELKISGNIASLTGLEKLDSVNSIELKNTQITSLDLRMLFKINNLNVSSNQFLRDIFIPLSNLTSLSRLLIKDNPRLEEVSLNTLDNVNPNANIEIESFNRNVLTPLVLNNTIHSLNIENAVFLGNLVIQGKRFKVNNQFELYLNPNYSSIENLSEFIDFGITLSILKFGLLSKFDLAGLRHFDTVYTMSVFDIDTLSNTDAGHLSTIATYLFVNNISNENLSIFNNLNIGALSASNNLYLINLKGVVIDTTLPNALNLSNNPILSDISILKEIESFHPKKSDLSLKLNFINNPLLDWCSYDLICNAIAETPDLVEISGNKGACEDVDAVATFCISADEEVAPITTLISIRDGVFYTTNDESIHHYEVYNTAGQLLLSETHLDGKMAPTHTGILIISYTTVQGRRGHVKLVR